MTQDAGAQQRIENLTDTQLLESLERAKTAVEGLRSIDPQHIKGSQRPDHHKALQDGLKLVSSLESEQSRRFAKTIKAMVARLVQESQVEQTQQEGAAHE